MQEIVRGSKISVLGLKKSSEAFGETASRDAAGMVIPKPSTMVARERCGSASITLASIMFLSERSSGAISVTKNGLLLRFANGDMTASSVQPFQLSSVGSESSGIVHRVEPDAKAGINERNPVEGDERVSTT